MGLRRKKVLGHRLTLTTSCLALLLYALLNIFALFHIPQALLAPHSSHITSSARAIRNFRLRDLHVYRRADGAFLACRLPAACLENNRERMLIHLPTTLRHRHGLVQDCIHPRMSIAYYDAYSPQYIQFALANIANLDLIGRSMTDFFITHMPHFLSMHLRFVALPAALFAGPSPYLPTRPLCASDFNQLVPCRNATVPLNPVLAVSMRALRSTWIRGYLSLFLRGLSGSQAARLDGKAGPLRILLAKQASKRAHCYRSVILSPWEHNARSFAADMPFRAAGVERGPSLSCSARVVLITRDVRKVFAGVAGARSVPIAVLDEMEKRITNSIKSMPGSVEASVHIVHELGSLNFTEQVRIMQQHDVVVSVHGAELSNAVFMRRRAAVVELFPFGYHMPNFAAVFKRMDLVHERVYSAPDFQAFLACMKDAVGEDLVLRLPKVRAVVEHFREMANRYEQAHTWEERDSIANFRHVGWQSVDVMARKCARAQRVRADPIRVSKIVERAIRQRCPQIRTQERTGERKEDISSGFD